MSSTYNSTINENAPNRILKNTIFLYVRSIVSLALKLYTSRVVLEELGIEDFGVYQLVGGLVVMFSFLNSTMASATQRFLSYEIGIGDVYRIRKVFSTTVNIHLLLSIFVLLLVESIGMYFLNTFLDIGNVDASTAQWILHFTALSLVFTINSVPYNSLLISRENMSYFAYIDIAGEVFKLLVGLSLSIFSSDKLIYYAMMMFAVSLIIRVSYSWVCRKKYKESHYYFTWDKHLIRQIASFSGWTSLSAISYMVKAQGVAMVLNVFFGPMLNAAVGIANQVNSAIKTFSQNFQMAFMPQITKTYARGEYAQMNKLVFSGAKLSTYLLMAIAGPVILEIDYFLELWLVKVPEYANYIIVLILLESILQTMTCTGNTAVRATGRVKWYEIIYNSVELLALPASVFILFTSTQYYIPFVVIIGFTVLSSSVKLTFIRRLIPGFRLRQYVINVFLKCFLFIAIAIAVPVMLLNGFDGSSQRMVMSAMIYELVLISLIILVGLNNSEKDLLKFIILKNKK